MSERPTPYSIAICTLVAIHIDTLSPIHDIELYSNHEAENVKSESNKLSPKLTEREKKQREEKYENQMRTLRVFLEECVSSYYQYISTDCISYSNKEVSDATPETEELKDDDGMIPKQLNTFSVPVEQQRQLRSSSWASISALSIRNLFIKMIERGINVSPIIRVLYDYLTMASSSIDSLMDLIDSLRMAATPVSAKAKSNGKDNNRIIDNNSSYGVYLRKMCLGFDQLSFEVITILYQAFTNEIRSIPSDLNRSSFLVTTQITSKLPSSMHEEEASDGPSIEITDNESSNFRGNIEIQYNSQLRNKDDRKSIINDAINYKDHSNDIDETFIWPFSANQMEEICRKECLSLELSKQQLCSQQQQHQGGKRQLSSHHRRFNNSISSPSSYEETELQILNLLEHNPELPSVHFLRFLNAIKNGERMTAFDSLHQYFDYAIIKDRRFKNFNNNRNGTNGGGSNGSGINTNNNDDDDNTNNNNANNNHSNGSSSNNSNDINNGMQRQPPQQDILQFSAVLLAFLYNNFGNTLLASLATEEAVRVAQQSMDSACVAFALGWTFFTGNGDKSKGILQRCSSRAAQGHLRTLVAGAKLSLAKYHLSSLPSCRMTNNIASASSSLSAASAGLVAAIATAADFGITATTPSYVGTFDHSSSSNRSTIANTAWTSLSDSISDIPGATSLAVESITLSSSARMASGSAAGAESLSIDRPSHMNDFLSSDELMDIIATSKLVGAGIWSYFGQQTLSGLSSFNSLFCHTSNINATDNIMNHRDIITAIQNCTNHVLHKPSSVMLSQYPFYHNVLYDHIKRLEMEIIDDKGSINKSGSSNDIIYDSTQGSFARGCSIYKQAIMKLIGLWEYYNFSTNDSTFILNITFLLYEWSIRRCEYDNALTLQFLLENYIHPSMNNYVTHAIDYVIQESLLLIRQSKFQQAKTRVNNMILMIYEKDNGNNSSSDNNLRYNYGRLLIQLTLIDLECNPSYFSSALVPLLECLFLTDKYEMDGLHAIALSLLAQIQYRMSNAKRSISIIKASLPSILQSQHPFFQGESYLTLAKCYLQLAKNTQQKKRKDQSTKEVSTTLMNYKINIKKINIKKLDQKKILKLLNLSCDALKKSEKIYVRCDEYYKLCEIFYLQARLYNSLHYFGDCGSFNPKKMIVKRDEASKKFLKLKHHIDSRCSAHNGNGNALFCGDYRSIMKTLTK